MLQPIIMRGRVQDKNSIEYQVYSEKEIRYKERYKIKKPVTSCELKR